MFELFYMSKTDKMQNYQLFMSLCVTIMYSPTLIQPLILKYGHNILDILLKRFYVALAFYNYILYPTY